MSTRTRFMVGISFIKTYSVWIEADDATDARDKTEALWAKDQSAFHLESHEVESFVLDSEEGA